MKKLLAAVLFAFAVNALADDHKKDKKHDDEKHEKGDKHDQKKH